MEMPLLQTKLYIPPLRPGLVPRPRLIERLNAGIRRKLTLVSAPAGFGKTTLVSEWLAGCEQPAAWLSLDESDNDLTRFLTYLIAALQTIEADIGKGVLVALQSPQPPPAEAILTALINEMAGFSDRIVLVLDDYHLIETRPIHDALVFLLRHLPPGMHLVIATREDPPLSLARLRARGQLTELRATDLRFTSSEAADFLNQVMGLDLSPENVAMLERRTEGWIAGLQLAAVSMQRYKDASEFIESFTGSHRFVLDYLIKEVLEQQSDSVQTFLLRTSVLDRLSGSLCDALTGQANGQETLEYLEHANLFVVSLDEERRWYRYHHLFADLLRQRLRQGPPSVPPSGGDERGGQRGGIVAELHIRASEWYERSGFVDEATEHALRGEHFERAAILIEEQADAVWGRGEHARLYRWLARLPNDVLLSKPQLCILQACDQFTSGQQDAAEQSLLAAENALGHGIALATETAPEERDPKKDPSKMRIWGRVAAIRAELAFYRGNIKGIHTYSRQALEYLPEHDLVWRGVATAALGDAYSFTGDIEQAYRVRSEAVALSQAGGNSYMILISRLKLAVTLRQQGRLQQAVEVCQQQLQLADESGMSHTDVVGCSLAIWAEVLAELNDLDEAIDLARKGVELAEHGEDVAILGWSYLCLMRILFSRGDMASAHQVIQKTGKTGRASDLPPWIANQVAAWQARMWLAQDKLDDASRWVLERGLSIDGELAFLREIEYCVLARLFLAQGRLDEAASLLRRLLEAAAAGGRTARVIEILNLQALAFQAGGDITQAMGALERALALAEPEGFSRIFVDEGPPMARLLYEALTLGIAPDYVGRLLSAFPVTEPERAASPEKKVTKSELIEPLSERELEVLQLIAEGLTNQEIASRLFLALNTVKSHSRNIYGKLGVHSRTQAVAQAQRLGLI